MKIVIIATNSIMTYFAVLIMQGVKATLFQVLAMPMVTDLIFLDILNFEKRMVSMGNFVT